VAGAPFTLVFALFFLVPLALIVMVSFWDFNDYELLPAFTFKNYVSIFEGCSQHRRAVRHLKTYLSTLKFCLLVWADHAGDRLHGGLLPGLPRALVGMQTLLFVLCTVPFWTSNVIRMISWVPLLGRNGLVNQGLMGAGLVDTAGGVAAVLRFLGGAGVCAPVHHVHDRADLQQHDAHRPQPDRSGARRRRQRLADAVERGRAAVRTGIIIGSIFVITIVMGDFVTIGVMGGQQIASVGKIIQVQTSYLQFPLAAANAVILLAVC
jgi:putative spermidine/putrescine transport system permease protein